jgi:hypothetical protein
MDSPKTNRDDRERQLDREIERYREAAVSALGQLQWIVGYLYKLRKSELASTLDRNRRKILEGIR